MSIKVRKGQGPEHISREEFQARFLKGFADPNFAEAAGSLAQIEEIAWTNYSEGRKAPLARDAGPEFKDPGYQLADEWRATHEAIKKAEVQQRDPLTRPRVLLIVASPRNDKTCPGEISKTFRMAEVAREILAPKAQVDLLDLSLLTSEFGRVIYPCKACVSTAMPLCHWPCSCYPNQSLGQTRDWMNEIYPRWVAAHGIFIITPVHWGQAPTTLKLMMDRLVCADGGNPDPTSTQGKNPDLAKKLETKGWDFPKHLAKRAYSLLVHGDTEGVDQLQYSMERWLNDLHLRRASGLGRFVGYYESYAASHEALDKDKNIFEEVKQSAVSLLNEMALIRDYKGELPDTEIDSVRPK